jgi:hypothetical protein
LGETFKTERKSKLDDKVGNHIGINLTQKGVEIPEGGERILIRREREEGRK